MEGIGVLAIPVKRARGVGAVLERSIAIAIGLVVTLGLVAGGLR